MSVRHEPQTEMGRGPQGTRCPPQGEHTFKGPAQTQVIGLELGSGETSVEKKRKRALAERTGG